MSLLGIDVGTTGCKAVAFDEDGRLLAMSYREHPLMHLQPDWSEVDPELIWSNVKELIGDVASKTASDPIQTAAISSMGEAVVPIKKNGETLDNFSVSFDHRTVEQYRWWEEHFGRQKLFRITGMPLHPMYTINKLMWLKAHRTEIFNLARRFLCTQDFVAYRLTGECRMDYSLAGRTMAFDVRKECWSEEIFTAADIDPGFLSEPLPSGEVVGTILPHIADELGLPKDVVIGTGGHDQPCGALGAGIDREGIAMNATGTSDVICPALDRIILSDELLAGNFCCYHHTMSGLYIILGFSLTGGLLLKWYRDTLCEAQVERAKKKNIDPYDEIIREASEEIRPLYFLPHFTGAGTPSLNPLSRGAILGLAVSTTRGDITRAVLDSTNYEMMYNLEAMEEAGIKVNEIRAIGGGARSKKWLQLKADSFGIKVTALDVSEAASLGAALLGGIARGIYRDAHEAIERAVRVTETYYPDEDRHEQYRKMYGIYRNIYPTLKPLNEKISQM